MNSKILLVGGDPNSINSEIIYKSGKKYLISKKKFILLANYDLIKKQLSSLKLKLKIKIVKIFNDKNNSNFLKL